MVKKTASEYVSNVSLPQKQSQIKINLLSICYKHWRSSHKVNSLGEHSVTAADVYKKNW